MSEAWLRKKVSPSLAGYPRRLTTYLATLDKPELEQFAVDAWRSQGDQPLFQPGEGRVLIDDPDDPMGAGLTIARGSFTSAQRIEGSLRHL